MFCLKVVYHHENGYISVMNARQIRNWCMNSARFHEILENFVEMSMCDGEIRLRAYHFIRFILLVK